MGWDALGHQWLEFTRVTNKSLQCLEIRFRPIPTKNDTNEKGQRYYLNAPAECMDAMLGAYMRLPASSHSCA